MVQLQALSRIVIIVYRLRQVLGHTQSTVYNSSRVSSRLIQNPECPIQSHLRCPIHIQSIGNSSRSRVRRHRGPLNLWSQLTQLNRVSQLTQLTRLTGLTQLTQLTNWVNWVRKFSVAAWSSQPLRPVPLLLLRVNWVNWGQLGPLGPTI